MLLHTKSSSSLKYLNILLLKTYKCLIYLYDAVIFCKTGYGAVIFYKTGYGVVIFARHVDLTVRCFGCEWTTFFFNSFGVKYPVHVTMYDSLDVLKDNDIASSNH